MNEPEIRQRIAEISSEIQSGSNRLEQLRNERTRLKKKLIDMGAAEREVSDHAVIRYLERIKGIDVEAARVELRQMANEADGFQGRRNDHYWHNGSGLVLLLNKEGGVITILSEKQAEKHIGRKLKDGKRAVRAEPLGAGEPEATTNETQEP